MSYRPLLFHRKKNLFGSFFGKYSGWVSPVVSAGAFIEQNNTSQQTTTTVTHNGAPVTHNGEEVTHNG